MEKKYIWIDQYNNCLMARNKKELMEKVGAKSGTPIYSDIAGKSVQTGYYISGLWFERYVMSPFTEDVKKEGK